MNKFCNWVFLSGNVLPFYFPGECRLLFFAVRCDPTKRTLKAHLKGLRITIRTYSKQRGTKSLLVLKKGEY